MQANPFLSLAVVQLPPNARILPSSWCPDKDLLLVITRQRSKDRISLYRMQGTKVWEVEFDADTPDELEIVDIAWSPDCQAIAVAHKPPRITLHSIQDGHPERIIPLAVTHDPVSAARPVVPSRIWWFMQEKKESTSDIPDIFKRGFDITGSAHSILKGQPLLDPLMDDTQPLTATDLFAFKQKPARGIASNQPAVIASWPTLPSDLLAASIQSAKLGGQRPRPGEDLDEADLTNMDSVLAVADDAGHLHCFLDGSYPLGIIAAMAPCITSMSLAKDEDMLFAHPQFTDPKMTSLRPAVIHLPYLQQRTLRDVARVSSSVRELVWYAMRVVKDMRAAWFGGEAQSGARELGPKWIRALETRMKDEFGQDEPYAMLDLTNLLATGRASEALADFLGSGEQMTERGMQKWEQSMIESLVMLRDYSEKRVAPACQRLHLLLEEVYGWSLLPQYQLCGISTVQVNACMDLAGRAVLLAGWLAATARRELVRFTEFMFWLRYETARLNTSGEGHNHPPAPRHDILEVNDYLMSGLVVSPIDRWFMGPVPQFSPHDLGVPGDWADMKSAAHRARRVLKEPRLYAWQYNIKQRDLSHLDRNLDSLVQELATRAHRIFFEAANATARSAVLRSKVNVNPDYFAENTTLLRAVELNSSALIRERTVLEPGQAARYTQFLLIQLPRVADRSYLCIARLHHGTDTIQHSVEAEVALMECCIPVNDASETRVPFEVLDAEFFDDSVFIIVYREATQPEIASIATVGYGDLIYTPIELTGMAGYARETLMQEVLNRLEGEQLSSEAAPLIQTRRLAGCREGKVTLAVNGRTGRRVACVLDRAGSSLEVVDIEGEEEETEVEESMSTAGAEEGEV